MDEFCRNVDRLRYFSELKRNVLMSIIMIEYYYLLRFITTILIDSLLCICYANSST
jgi:hypothetical protein